MSLAELPFHPPLRHNCRPAAHRRWRVWARVPKITRGSKSGHRALSSRPRMNLFSPCRKTSPVRSICIAAAPRPVRSFHAARGPRTSRDRRPCKFAGPRARHSRHPNQFHLPHARPCLRRWSLTTERSVPASAMLPAAVPGATIQLRRLSSLTPFTTTGHHAGPSCQDSRCIVTWQ